MAGVVTDGGLTAQVGVAAVWTGVTAQDSATLSPLVEFIVFSVRLEVDLPPGSMANGDGGDAVRVKSAWPKAGASADMNRKKAST